MRSSQRVELGSFLRRNQPVCLSRPSAMAALTLSPPVDARQVEPWIGYALHRTHECFPAEPTDHLLGPIHPADIAAVGLPHQSVIDIFRNTRSTQGILKIMPGGVKDLRSI